MCSWASAAEGVGCRGAIIWHRLCFVVGASAALQRVRSLGRGRLWPIHNLTISDQKESHL